MRDTQRIHHVDEGFSCCPNCGLTLDKAHPPHSTSEVELGFCHASEVPRTGVTGAHSFTWTMMSHKWRLQTMKDAGHADVCVVDEYGRKYTAAQFLDQELAAVVIEFQHAGRFC